MPRTDPVFWSERLRQTLERYDEPLLRRVAARLVRPRNHWPVEELIERCAATAANAPVIDRRLADLGPCERRMLALIGHSRQPRWNLGNLIELLIALGEADGLRPILHLFDAGLLFPDLVEAGLPRLRDFEHWLTHAGAAGLPVFTHPLFAARALGEDLGLPCLDCRWQMADCRLEEEGAASGNLQSAIYNLQWQEADGLEWPLRLTALWQVAAVAPLRRTLQGEFFKRDFERLTQNPLLNGPAAEGLIELPDASRLAVALAEAEGLLAETDGELRASPLPACWEEGLLAALESLWAALPQLRGWNSTLGSAAGEAPAGNPYPSANLLALLLLARLPEDAWTSPADVEAWVLNHHPYWSGMPPAAGGITTFVLGLAHQLRLVQAARGRGGDWLVRLSPTGRWLLGLAEPPAPSPAYPQTLLVQPNLEILAYRQGLTPGLIARLSQFATWKTLGAACTLQLEPESVYRALESGLTLDAMLLTLEQHGMRSTPAAVVESLRTWAGKRDRISIYPSATLLEFGTADDLNEALARGLPALRLSERMALAANEDAIDFRHFRLTGTRDYSLPPEKCVTVEGDGVTLTVDLSRSDLLLETELPRFAALVQRSGANGRVQYRLTPASLMAARDNGWGVEGLATWFQQRAGRPLSAAARLLLTGSEAPPFELRRHLVLHVESEELADGLWQWPETRALLHARLGPTALAVAEDKANELREQLRALGLRLPD
jgi:hypothetical protein